MQARALLIGRAQFIMQNFTISTKRTKRFLTYIPQLSISPKRNCNAINTRWQYNGMSTAVAENLEGKPNSCLRMTSVKFF